MPCPLLLSRMSPTRKTLRLEPRITNARSHTEEGRQAYNHFTYRTYKKDGEACTGHYIREYVLNEIVLEDLHRVTSAAREHPEKFAAYIGSKQSAELQREIRRQEKKLADTEAES